MDDNVEQETIRQLNEVENPRATVLVLGYGRAETKLIDSLAAAGCEVWHTSEPLTSIPPFDAVVSFGYRHILKPDTIASSSVPIINLHVSHLPWNRGAHPNFWAFLDGTPSGVTIHLIDKGIDTGPILFQRRVHFDRGEATFVETHRRLVAEIETLFEDNLTAIIDGTYPVSPQVGPGSHHRVKDLPADFRGWDSSIADEVVRLRRHRDRPSSSAVIVLAHLMDEHLVLNDESRGRADAAIAVAVEHAATCVVTSGWAYRPDADTPIAEVMKDYITRHTAASGLVVIAETNSRDTVGDAVFFKANILHDLEIDTLHVVTSDYHVERSREIFEFFLGDQYELVFHAVPTPHSIETLDHEAESIQAFRATFDRSELADTCSAVSVLEAKHPFYNGQVFPEA